MRTKFSCISVFRVALGPRVKLASRKHALNHLVVFVSKGNLFDVHLFYYTAAGVSAMWRQ